MAKKLDQIIIVDLEATCWEGDPPPQQEQEIIEIGVCVLTLSTLQISGGASILVRPDRSTVSPFCTRLTTLTQEQLEREGTAFDAAVQHLSASCRPSERTWASYGDFDRILFQRQCQQRGVPYPFGRTHLNVKNLLAVSLNLPHEIGLDQAVEKLNLTFQGTHHRGVDDAWNIACVLTEIIHRTRKENRS